MYACQLFFLSCWSWKRVVFLVFLSHFECLILTLGVTQVVFSWAVIDQHWFLFPHRNNDEHSWKKLTQMLQDIFLSLFYCHHRWFCLRYKSNKRGQIWTPKSNQCVTRIGEKRRWRSHNIDVPCSRSSETKLIEQEHSIFAKILSLVLK